MPEDLRQRGIIRLADLFRLVPGWQQLGTDGFNVSIRNIGSPLSPQGESPAILLNGIPLQFHPFQPPAPNLLPVTVDMIDSLFIFEEPVHIEGRFYPAGAINFITIQGDRKSGLRARDMIGNETGDPGPYAYTEYATPNVDRLGPDYSGGIDLSLGSVQLRTNLSWRHHYYTDPQLLRQNPGVSGKNMRGHWVMPFIQLSGKNSWKLQAHYATTERFLESFGAYQFYVPEAGRHIPGQLRRWQAAAVSPGISYGAIRWSAGLQISRHSWNELPAPTRRESEYLFGSGWIQGKTRWKLHRLALSAEAAAQKLKTEPAGNTTRLRPFRLSGEIYKPDGWSGLNYRLQAGLYFLEGAVRPQAALFLGRRFAEKQALSLHILYFTRPSEENHLRRERQLFFAPLTGSAYSVPKDPEHQAIRLSLTYRFFPNPATRLTLRTGWLHNRELTMEENWQNRAGGSLAFGTLAIDRRLRHNLRCHLQLSGLQQVSGDPTYEKGLKTRPQLQAEGQIFYEMAGTFTIALFSRYLSKSEFSGFSDGRVPDKWLWDAVLNKSLWSRRAYFQVVFRNLFDDEERSHPQGSRLNFRWFVQLGINFYAN
ncbi:MAG: hypothetical protein Kow0037_26540 [Calditrichia bacterium]